MYKTILAATDGSDIASRAVQAAIELAKSVRAKLVVVTVTEPIDYFATSEYGITVVEPSDFKELVRQHAEKRLAAVAKKANAEGVDCTIVHEEDHLPYAGIIKAAKDTGADLIVVGSHGRRGLEGLLIGSEAVKTLTHTKLPTLVVR